MNSKVKTVFLIILLLIPTYLAIAVYAQAQKNPVELRAVSRLEVKGPDEQTHTYEKSSENGKAVIAELIGINNRADEVSEIPAEIKASPAFLATYYSYNKTSAYSYYVGENPDQAYMTDGFGKSFKLESADASLFTDADYAACLYEGSKYPVLTLGGETAVPHTYEWRYKRFSGTYKNVTVETTNAAVSYPINARLDMAFDIEPDLFTVRITDGDREIFNDDYKNIVNLDIGESRELTFHIEARWYETEGKSGQGTAVYDFNAKVNTPAVFYTTFVGEEAMVPGDFFMITAKNIAADATIKFTSEPAINYVPTFVPDGAYYRALIPISYELSGGKYVFTLESDGVSQSFNVNIEKKSFKSITYTIDNSIVASTRTEATLAKFEAELGPVAKALTVTDGTLFYGKFGEGVPADAQVSAGVGITRKINGGTAYRHQGVDYYLKAGTEITAVNDGVVVYAASTALSGNMVVIEHGLGLKSWYCHLDSILVNVGDKVEKGVKIGTVGKTGFADQNMAHIALSVFDVPVSPYKLWEDELEMIKP